MAKKRIIATILLTLVAVSVFFLPVPAQKAEATTSFDITTWFQTLIDWYTKNEGWVKEYVLDPAVWVASKEMVHQISQSIVEWANGGFDGNPMFITNFGDFLENASNEASGVIFEKISEAGVDMCGEFAPMLKASFSYTKPFELNMKCTINDVIGNVEDFYNNFEEGGWKTWFALTMEPQNSPYGAYFTTWAEYQKAVEQKKAATDTETKSSEGFLSAKKCVEHDPECFGGGDCCLRFETVTPGKLIAERLEKVTGNDLKQLQLADEFNEILVAVVSNLTKKLFEDAGGGGSRGMLDYSPSPAELNEDASLNFMRTWTEAKAYYELSVSMIDGRNLIYTLRKLIVDVLSEVLMYLDGLIACAEKKTECLSDPSKCGIDLTNEESADEWEQLFNIINDLIKYKAERFKIAAELKKANDRLEKSDEFVDQITAFWKNIDGIKNQADGATGRAPNNTAENDELAAVGIDNMYILQMRSSFQELKSEIDKDGDDAEQARNYRDRYYDALKKCDPNCGKPDPISGEVTLPFNGCGQPSRVTPTTCTGNVCQVGCKITVDDPYATFTNLNNWACTSQSGCHGGICKYSSAFTCGNDGTRNGTVTWKITAPFTATYSIIASYMGTENRDASVEYRIVNPSGTVTKIENQYRDRADFPSGEFADAILGSYHLNQNDTSKVILVSEGGSASADAAIWTVTSCGAR